MNDKDPMRHPSRRPSLSALLSDGIGTRRRWGTIEPTLLPMVKFAGEFRVQVTVYPPGTTSREAALITLGQWATSPVGAVLVAVTGALVWFGSGLLGPTIATVVAFVVIGTVLARRSSPLRRGSVVITGRATRRHPDLGAAVAVAIEMLEPLDLIDEPVLYEHEWGSIHRTLQSR